MTQTFRKWWFPAIFQLTRSRGAWREHPLLLCLFIFISTHTLTWSVTFQKFFVSKLNMTFQLTRSRGAWHSCKNTLSAFPISTHTLTWSVTLLVISLIGITGFQLTRSRGAWLKCFLILWISSAFQLTRSRGAWHPQLWPYNRQRYFNSHAHVERDLFSCSACRP